MGWGTEWAVAMVLMKLMALQAQETPPPSWGGADALPGCPSDCGGVPIPYPFGVGGDCSHPTSKYFEVNCTDNKPMLADKSGEFRYHISNISLSDSTVRVSTSTPPICHSNWTSPTIWSTYNMRLAPSANVFAVLGCDVLAFFFGRAVINEDYVDTASGPTDHPIINQTVGCVPVCQYPGANRRTTPVEIGVCKDRCCQTSIDIPAFGYDTVGRKINVSELTNLSNVTECYHAFVVEKGKFNFSVAKDTVLRRDSITSILLVEWSIGDYIVRSCEDALKNMNSYGCVSRNSECVNSKSYGYNCRCRLGYEGNPISPMAAETLMNVVATILYAQKIRLASICLEAIVARHSRQQQIPKNQLEVIGFLRKKGSFHLIEITWTCACFTSTMNNHRFLLIYSSHLAVLCFREDYNVVCLYSTRYSNIAGIAIGVGIASALFLLFAILALCYRRWKKQIKTREKERHVSRNHDMLQQQLLYYPSGGENITKLISFFAISDLKKATNNFDVSHIVGQGGHGTVYKGLMDLRVVAIKKSKATVQREIEGFINEIILLSQISHRNVVKLIGCCFEAEVPLLVYEFISNGTLADHLHTRNRDTPLSWEDRLRIAIEISRALSYLHSSASISIFHRDIKSANILLDERLTTKISDFGASKFIEMDETHVSTNIQGTLGYLDPEYMHTGQLTEKSDVYSLGVILVELVTGEKPTSKMKSQEERNMISHFIWALEENNLFRVVEASIVDDDNREEIATVARLAVDCLRLRGTERPTMKEVEVTLQGLRKSKVQKRLKAVAPKYEHEQVESVSYHSSSCSRSENTNQSVNSMWTSS